METTVETVSLQTIHFTLHRLRASLGPKPELLDGGGAFERFIKQSGVKQFRSDGNSICRLYGIDVVIDKRIPENMAVIKEPGGKLYILDMRTDEEKAECSVPLR